MNPLELDDYHEKELADLTAQIGFDPEPVSDCSQLSLTWGESISVLGFSCFAHCLSASWVLVTKLQKGNFNSF